MAIKTPLAGTNFLIEEVNFDSNRPYTVELRGHMYQSNMLSCIKGFRLEIEYPQVLSKKGIEFVEKEIMKHFSDGIKTQEEIEKVEKSLPVLIHVPGKYLEK